MIVTVASENFLGCPRLGLPFGALSVLLTCFNGKGRCFLASGLELRGPGVVEQALFKFKQGTAPNDDL